LTAPLGAVMVYGGAETAPRARLSARTGAAAYARCSTDAIGCARAVRDSRPDHRHRDNRHRAANSSAPAPSEVVRHGALAQDEGGGPDPAVFRSRAPSGDSLVRSARRGP